MQNQLIKHLIGKLQRPDLLILAKNVANGTLEIDNLDELYDILFDYYSDEMPYGTQKARTGDPFEWITEKLKQDLPELLTIDELYVLVGSYTANKSSHIRKGQQYFNSLYEINPVLADKVRTTEADPFYNDNKLEAFFKAICLPEVFEVAKEKLI
jgi:hypothetical protein